MTRGITVVNIHAVTPLSNLLYTVSSFLLPIPLIWIVIQLILSIFRLEVLGITECSIGQTGRDLKTRFGETFVA